jgi:folate-binding protein YgfZ
MAVHPPETHPTRSAASIAARDGAVACDLAALSEAAIAGPDAAKFLNGQLSIDVAMLASDACRYACFNTPKGRVLANFVVWRDASRPDGYRVLLPGDIAPGVVKRLSMYVLRSKVTLADASSETVRVGIGGPAAAAAMAAVFGAAPPPFGRLEASQATVLGLPGPRYVVIAPLAASGALHAALSPHTATADFEVWRWLTICAGVPVVTAPTQEAFIAQMVNWDALGGIDFQKGCYTGQEIIARTRYLGRLKERAYLFHAVREGARAGDRVFSAAFGEQPCGTVVNAAATPGGGCDLIAVVQIAAAQSGDVHLDSPDGAALGALPLPYEIPAPSEPRGRIA